MRFAFQTGMCAPDQHLPLAKSCEEIGFDAFTLPDNSLQEKLGQMNWFADEVIKKI